MRASFAPATILALVLCLFLPGRILAQGTTVVGDGTPASCTVAGAVTIDGGGLVTLSGEDAHRHFVVTTEGSLRLANLTLSGGSAVEGGGSIHS